MRPVAVRRRARGQRAAFALGAARQTQHRVSARFHSRAASDRLSAGSRGAGGVRQRQIRAHGSEYGGVEFGASAGGNARKRHAARRQDAPRRPGATALWARRRAGTRGRGRTVHVRSVRALVCRRGHIAGAVVAARLSSRIRRRHVFHGTGAQRRQECGGPRNRARSNFNISEHAPGRTSRVPGVEPRAGP